MAVRSCAVRTLVFLLQQGPATTAQISEALDVKYGSAKVALRTLSRLGYVRPAGTHRRFRRGTAALRWTSTVALKA